MNRLEIHNQTCLVEFETRKANVLDIKQAAEAEIPRDQCFACGSPLSLAPENKGAREVALTKVKRIFMPIMGEEPSVTTVQGLICNACAKNDSLEQNIAELLQKVGFISSLAVMHGGSHG